MYLYKVAEYKSFILGANRRGLENYVWEDGTPWNWTNWEIGKSDEDDGGSFSLFMNSYDNTGLLFATEKAVF